MVLVLVGELTCFQHDLVCLSESTEPIDMAVTASLQQNALHPSSGALSLGLPQELE